MIGTRRHQPSTRLPLLVELMREAGVLVGIEGSPRSSLKLRPPLIVRPQHVDIFIEALDSSLDEVERQRA